MPSRFDHFTFSNMLVHSVFGLCCGARFSHGFCSTVDSTFGEYKFKQQGYTVRTQPIIYLFNKDYFCSLFSLHGACSIAVLRSYRLHMWERIGSLAAWLCWILNVMNDVSIVPAIAIVRASNTPFHAHGSDIHFHYRTKERLFRSLH